MADRGAIELVSAQVATTEGGYLAAARAGTDTVVAVARNRIDWLDRAADRFQIKAKLNVELPTAVACFPAPGAHETLVVCSDGMIAHVAPQRRARKGKLDG